VTGFVPFFLRVYYYFPGGASGQKRFPKNPNLIVCLKTLRSWGVYPPQGSL